jgi:ribosomal protein S18 acetylase RimI-like enzyme
VSTSAARVAVGGVEREMPRLLLQARSWGVEIAAEVLPEGSVWISRIDRTTGRPGSGRRVIELLSDLADEEEIDVSLACEADNLPLVSYYESIGFVIDVEATRERGGSDDHVVMTRRPE